MGGLIQDRKQDVWVIGDDPPRVVKCQVIEKTSDKLLIEIDNREWMVLGSACSLYHTTPEAALYAFIEGQEKEQHRLQEELTQIETTLDWARQELAKLLPTKKAQ